MTRLCILSCGNFQREVEACIAAEGWTDVVSASFPPRCGRPAVSWHELEPLLPDACSKVLVLGRSCMAKLDTPPTSLPPVEIRVQEQCFHLIAPPTLVDTAISEGGYLMSPGWLCNWRAHVADMGFTADTVGGFYQDFARQLVLLDTGVDSEAAAHAEAFSRAAGLPVQRFVVGLSHLKLTLRSEVLAWRLSQAHADAAQRARDHAAEVADQACALELLGQLNHKRQETEVIAAMEELFYGLFAPTALYYQRVENNQRSANYAIPAWLASLPLSAQQPYAWVDDGRGFALVFMQDGQELGRMGLEGLAFVQYRERYLNMALGMTGVCALAIENCRTRKRLVEAEKMASLGVMVAGVAHEVNTPVGVSMLAASTVQRETTKLAQSFTQRTMTQSALQSYLHDAQSQTGLILANLERVGKLIDAFRKVAVHGGSQARSSIRLSDCLKETIASMGTRLSGEGYSVKVDCDASLEFHSYPADWASIFSNLISNSLQHGFKGLATGCISISARKQNGTLIVDYADDGHGLTTEARNRVFDPFFTTDLQSGMGLGMHLVFNLISQRMGGTIACVAPAPKGAGFHIEIPLNNEPVQG